MTEVHSLLREIKAQVHRRDDNVNWEAALLLASVSSPHRVISLINRGFLSNYLGDCWLLPNGMAFCVRHAGHSDMLDAMGLDGCYNALQLAGWFHISDRRADIGARPTRRQMDVLTTGRGRGDIRNECAFWPQGVPDNIKMRHEKGAQPPVPITHPNAVQLDQKPGSVITAKVESMSEQEARADFMSRRLSIMPDLSMTPSWNAPYALRPADFLRPFP